MIAFYQVGLNVESTRLLDYMAGGVVYLVLNTTTSLFHGKSDVNFFGGTHIFWHLLGSAFPLRDVVSPGATVGRADAEG
jgi:hypothetical protein